MLYWKLRNITYQGERNGGLEMTKHRYQMYT
jgi:hypothetical protein